MTKILATYEKQPREKRWFGIDFKEQLDAFATTVLSYAFEADTGIEIDGDTLVDGAVLLLFSGGTAGQKYKATVLLSTADGQKFEGDIFIKVKEA